MCTERLPLARLTVSILSCAKPSVLMMVIADTVSITACIAFSVVFNAVLAMWNLLAPHGRAHSASVHDPQALTRNAPGRHAAQTSRAKRPSAQAVVTVTAS